MPRRRTDIDCPLRPSPARDPRTSPGDTGSIRAIPRIGRNEAVVDIGPTGPTCDNLRTHSGREPEWPHRRSTPARSPTGRCSRSSTAPTPTRSPTSCPRASSRAREPHVHVNIYNVPVKGEPEYGVSTKVVADYDGTPGYYGIGLGIDQESAIFISQELNGQPKFPCSIVYFRRDDVVEARCTHQGYTFLEFHGQVTGVADDDVRRVRGARLVDQVVARGRRRREELRLPAARRRRRVGTADRAQGDRRRRRSCCATARGTRTPTLLPMREQLSAHLVWSASEEPRDHARRPARPDRVLALRRHHRRLALARLDGRPALRSALTSPRLPAFPAERVRRRPPTG